MALVLKERNNINPDQLKYLYSSVQWTAYTNDMPRLVESIKNSLKVITAWDGDQLIGLIRAVGDGCTIIYIQDILVLPDYQNTGVGSQLMEKLLLEYQNVRQKVLLTHDESVTRAFYEKHGFESCDQGDAVAFARLE
ncbi:GNAT family N-acetyltransferase [Lentibacillus sp. CBA3610]|uniref:GNAT family N-acetyltransferase n=1 Tax=Lentibacillus sp. CBA3610 TaxID=2518176 RepID=UPI001595799F|nr:GNAT family N-acetyltransferase [Lentibacillus sp. CBA3610]QKY68373.1 N-acetyltransferase [Lentibacillus sp. CBA3610]